MNNDTITNYISKLSLEIRKERKKRNIPTKEAARSLNLQSSTYSNLENNPTKSTSLLKYSLMVNILKVPLSSVLKNIYYEGNDINKTPIVCDEYENLNSEQLIHQTLQEIKKERIHKGVYQRVIAEKIGIHRRYLSDIESGKSIQLSLYRFIEISEVLEVPLYVLVERAEQSLVEKAKNNDI